MLCVEISDEHKNIISREEKASNFLNVEYCHLGCGFIINATFRRNVPPPSSRYNNVNKEKC
jgi:hypothetical protein